MPRLPFDPSKVAKQPPPRPARRERARTGGAAAARDVLSVSQLSLLIKRTLADHTPTPIKVVGEVSNFAEKGHWFLSLKDEENVINCVMWRSAAAKVGFEPQRGTQVVATGRLDFYGPQGRVQLYIDKLEPVGQGALELKFRQLCDALRQRGYFEPARKKPMPAFPCRVAVVTSESGAALQDVIRTTAGRWAGCQLLLVGVRVQGAQAAGEIARAIRWLCRDHRRLKLDAVIITRGGGSLEDLWAFNERIVADAIYAAPLPIVAAIGHEVDTTIAELVADLRCSTPTQAAERLIPDARAEHQQIGQLAHRLGTALRRRAESAEARLVGIERHELFRTPLGRIVGEHQDLAAHRRRLIAALQHRLHDARHTLMQRRQQLDRLEPAGRLALARQRLAGLERSLGQSMRTHHAAARRQLDALQRQLQAVGPRNVLRRGYSYTTDAAGQLVRSVNQVDAGDRVRTHLADGTFDATVTDPAGTDAPAPTRKPPRSKKAAPTPRGRSAADAPTPRPGKQGDLFG